MRNFLIIVGVVLGVTILAFAGMGLFLMLSPGAKLFGVQYVKALTETSADVTRTVSEAPSGNVIIETYGVPTTISYSSTGFFEFHFVQKFNGFTRSSLEKPSIAVYTNDDGDLVVKTSEFVPFIWGSNNDGYVLDCRIPYTFSNRGLTVSSTKSKIVIGSDQYSIGNVSEMSVISKGAIMFSGSMKIDTLKVNVSKNKLVIPSTFDVDNLEINSGNKSVAVECDVQEKISFTSKKGSLTFKTCGELVVETKKGTIESTASETSVFGSANIQTASGKVILQHIGGNLSAKTTSGGVFIGQNLNSTKKGVVGTTNIETTSGNVNLIGKYGTSTDSVKITTTKGHVNIGDNSRTKNEKLAQPLSDIYAAEINTINGNINIESITTVNATTKSGNVVVGSFRNANIKTTSGNVDIVARDSAIFCIVNIETGKGNVSVKNISNESTTINSQGSVYAQFRTIIGKIDINGKNKEVKVVLPNAVDESRIIWMDSNNKDSLVHVGEISEKTKSYHSVETVPVDNEAKLIRVASAKGKVTLINQKYE